MKRLNGHTILIAGGGGIGAGLARRYTTEGANVVLGDIDLDGAEAVADEIRVAGGSIVATYLDGGSEDAVDAAAALAVSQFGGIDGLHVNYANFADGDAEKGVGELPLEAFEESFRVNLIGTIMCVRAVLPSMLGRGRGSIVFTTSASAWLGEPVRPAYAMSKSALTALMRHVASRYGERGIRANCVSPGLIIHDRFPQELKEMMEATSLQRTLQKKRLGAPEDIAAAGAYLLSEDAAYVTGQILAVDGGVTMRP